VNLKIALQPFLRAKAIDLDGRNRLLEECKAEVCRAVTAHNWSQSRCLSLDELRSQRGIEEFMWLLDALEREGELDRAEEALPGTDALGARRDKGLGLARPELAILLGFAKLDFYHKLVASDLLDAPAFLPLFDGYFPEAVRRLDPALLHGHPLRREITATQLANHIVDWAGVCFFREMEGDRRDPAEIAAAYVLAESVLGARALRRDLEATGFEAPIQARYTGYMQVQDTLEESTRWVLTVLGPPESWSDIAGDIRATLERVVNVPETSSGPCAAPSPRAARARCASRGFRRIWRGGWSPSVRSCGGSRWGRSRGKRATRPAGPSRTWRGSTTPSARARRSTGCCSGCRKRRNPPSGTRSPTETCAAS
jgi:glutamate dehydrogenase